jgi:hypothetical protein
MNIRHNCSTKKTKKIGGKEKQYFPRYRDESMIANYQTKSPNIVKYRYPNKS